MYIYGHCLYMYVHIRSLSIHVCIHVYIGSLSIHVVTGDGLRFITVKIPNLFPTHVDTIPTVHKEVKFGNYIIL